MDKNIVDKLDEHDWESSIIVLSAYVLLVCRLNRWKLPLHMEPEDVVMEAIAKVYDGTRVWKPANDPNLQDFMRSVIKSMINNLKMAPGIQTVGVEASERVAHPDEIKAKTDLQDINEKISTSIRGDPELAILFKALKDGLRPLEISKEYVLDIKVIRNAQKRLRKLVSGILDL